LVNELLPILGQVLVDSGEVGDDQDRIISLELMEELKEKAISQLPTVLPLLEARNNEVRYRAARAVIASNVDKSAATKALRSIVNSVNFRDLLVNHDLNGLTNLTESLLKDPTPDLSLIEKRDLLKLLKELRGPNSIVPEPIESLIPQDEKAAISE
jgi:hypothetical protein